MSNGRRREKRKPDTRTQRGRPDRGREISPEKIKKPGHGGSCVLSRSAASSERRVCSRQHSTANSTVAPFVSALGARVEHTG